jgi:plastocyanin
MQQATISRSTWSIFHATARGCGSSTNFDDGGTTMSMKEMIMRAIAAAVFCLAAMSSGGAAWAQQRTTIPLTLKDHRFEPAEPHASAGQPLTIVLKNLDPTPAEFESKTLRVEKVVVGGGQVTINIRPLAAGRYRFFDDFHEEAQGFLVVE